MQIEFEGKKIIFERIPSKLDEMAMYFSKKLRNCGIEHVFVSGYVSILFGRNRASEDIDIIIERISMEKFLTFWNSLDRMECIITSEPEEAYEYLKESIAVRFSWIGKIIPNIEMKFSSNYVHRKALNEKITVVLNGVPIPISPLELQIAYKLFLGSEKDIEDARFLFDLFRDNMDLQKLIVLMKSLKVDEKKSKEYLGWSDVRGN